MAHRMKGMDVAGLGSFAEMGEGMIIDVLPPEHFQRRHFPGAVNACVYEVNFLDQVVSLGARKETSLLLYGAGPDSLDSRTAAEKLLREGYEDVAVLSGGLEALRATGIALDGEAPGEIDPPHPVLSFQKTSYELVPAESFLKWAGRNDNGGHWGFLAPVSGSLVVEADNLSASVALDMATIENRDLEDDQLRPVLENHLKSDDFFFVSMFPHGKFTLKQAIPRKESTATTPNYDMTGELHVRGIGREISFPASVRSLPEGRLAVMANFDLDRTHWGVIYGSARFFQHLSYHVVYDSISIEFRVVFQ